MTKLNQDSGCSALTKSGKPCRAAATDGGLCFFHANPKKPSELGRIGGQKNGRIMAGSTPLPDLDSVSAVRDAVKRLISDVYTGKLHPRTAAGIAPLLQLQMRAIEKTDFDQRLAKLEKQLVRLKECLEQAAQERQKNQSSGPSGASGKRPPQAVKPYSSNEGSTADES